MWPVGGGLASRRGTPAPSQGIEHRVRAGGDRHANHTAGRWGFAGALAWGGLAVLRRGGRAGLCPNVRSTIGWADRRRFRLFSPVGRPTPGGLRGGGHERIVGQGRGATTGDGIRRNRQADLAASGWPCAEDLDEGSATGQAEDQADGQEHEFTDGHAARISGSYSLMRGDSAIAA
jgi:hypothetical protein